MRTRRLIASMLLLASLTGCGGSSDEPAVTTAPADDPTGVANGIEQIRRVADRAEDRLNQMDDLAPSP